MGRYPVQRQRFPDIARSTSAAVSLENPSGGSGLPRSPASAPASEAARDMHTPGVQKPHCEAWNPARRACTAWNPARPLPSPSVVVTARWWSPCTSVRHEVAAACDTAPDAAS
uniref:Uncharacterized protein n=1 Tax=Arundo donax TaxID=35708 RepID=A0A0A9DLI7_ARUDO